MLLACHGFYNARDNRDRHIQLNIVSETRKWHPEFQEVLDILVNLLH